LHKKHSVFSHLERFIAIDKLDKTNLFGLEAIYA